MKNLRLAILLIAPVLLSCSFTSWGNCEEEEGKISRTELTVESFSKIKLNGSHTVYVTQSDQQKVEIETTENIKALLDAKVQDDQWSISFKKCISTNKGVKFYVSIPDVKALSVNGSGDIISQSTITSDQLQLKVNGSGDINLNIVTKNVMTTVKGSGDVKLKGKTQEQTASVNGSGDYSAYELMSSMARASVNGSGDIQINVTDQLEARVNGSGDIDYMGNPKNVDSKVNGSGDIDPK